MMEFRTARLADLDTYIALAKVAQAWLQDRGLGQYVPAAHEHYIDALRSQIIAGTLYAVWSGDTAIAFFNLSVEWSTWWPLDDTSALYVSGIVVSTQKRGQGVGAHILRWCVREAVRRGCQFLRLDCHAGNSWLCRYYEAQGFTRQGTVPQHPGYQGCLYQFAVGKEEILHVA